MSVRAQSLRIDVLLCNHSLDEFHIERHGWVRRPRLMVRVVKAASLLNYFKVQGIDRNLAVCAPLLDLVVHLLDVFLEHLALQTFEDALAHLLLRFRFVHSSHTGSYSFLFMFARITGTMLVIMMVEKGKSAAVAFLSWSVSTLFAIILYFVPVEVFMWLGRF